MEDIKQSIVNSDQSTVNQTSLSTVHRPPNSFLVILLSSLLIIFCLIAVFFAVQAQKLKIELTNLKPTSSVSPEPVSCTLEAKICPDGSAVGRSGPNCEFSPCPTQKF